MQAPTYVKAQDTGSTPTPQDLKINTSGKSPNPYQVAVIIFIVDMKFYKITTPQQKTKRLKHPLLQSPYTRVYGRRKIYDKNNNSLNMKTKLKTNTTTYLLKHIDILKKLRSKLVLKALHKYNTTKTLPLVTTKYHTSHTSTYMIVHIIDLTKTHIIESKLGWPYLRTYRQKSNATKILISKSIKKQTTNPLATIKHKKPNSYKNIRKSSSPLIYEKKTLAKTQNTLNIRKLSLIYNKCSHLHHKSIKLTYGNHSRAKMTGQGKAQQARGGQSS